MIAPQLVRGSAANSAVRVGLLGCGNRGMTHANNITKFTDARMVAFGDLYQDKLDRARQRFPDAALGVRGRSGVPADGRIEGHRRHRDRNARV